MAIATQDGNTPVIALLRRDWEFLFNQLRSTHAVVGYLHRVAASAPVLGGEPERYYELAAADAEAVPGALDPSWTRRGGQPHSVPLLPAAPAGSDDDEAHTMVRIMLEAWQRVLASLDSLPVGSARTWAVSSSTPWPRSPRPNRAPRPGGCVPSLPGPTGTSSASPSAPP
ncbi:hypothetical protein [Streptomyces sp. NPDC056405]|uniref:hypothetical protein n=1 Tax=Streptomyces sp. NPDC056405 TaxID=3345811 RepID=UPI0035D9003C